MAPDPAYLPTTEVMKRTYGVTPALLAGWDTHTIPPSDTQPPSVILTHRRQQGPHSTLQPATLQRNWKRRRVSNQLRVDFKPHTCPVLPFPTPAGPSYWRPTDDLGFTDDSEERNPALQTLTDLVAMVKESLDTLRIAYRELQLALDRTGSADLREDTCILATRCSPRERPTSFCYGAVPHRDGCHVYLTDRSRAAHYTF
ncbi:unnamed protein product [Lota lota]